MNKQQGHNLIEFLLVISLSLYVFVIALKLYQVTLNNYKHIEQANAERQTLTITADYLSKLFFNSGYAGCLTSHHYFGTSSIQLAADGKGAELFNAYPLLVFKSNFRLWQFILPKGKTLAKGDMLLLSNCRQALLIKPSKVLRNKVYLDNPIAVHSGEQLFAWRESRLFVKKTTRKNSKGHYIYSLYQQLNAGRKQELMPNLDQISLTKGLGQQYQLTLTSGDYKITRELYAPNS